MARAGIAVVVLLLLSGTAGAQDARMSPELASFTATPRVVSQCRPVRVYFRVTNRTDSPVYSQAPYAGATYNLYHTLKDKGIETLPDRLTVGVSLDGGKDGYPFRWGLRGPLGPGRSATIMGFLSLIEVGDYTLTAQLLLGDQPVGRAGALLVKVRPYDPQTNAIAPTLARPLYPIVNGRRVARMTPYEQAGYLLLPVRPFALGIGAGLDYVENSVVITKPNLEVVLFADKQQVLVNGIPVQIPVPVQEYNGITYAPLRYISPLLGQTFYWYPKTRVLFMEGSAAQ